MSNRSDDASADSGQLFQNMDRQEQVFAPQQVPGDRAADDQDVMADRSDQGANVIPAVPPGGALGTASTGGGPGVLPFVPAPDLATDDDTDRRDAV